MIILPDRNVPRSKILMPVQPGEWRVPSRAQPKNIFGHENQTRFCVTARIDDGHIVWRGWFDDRDDFDQFLWSMARGTLRQDRYVQRLPTPWWNPDLQDNPYLSYDFVTVVFRTSGASWTVNADCTGISGQANEFIDVIGAGASGAAGTGFLTGTTGGGGGAWSRITGAGTPYALTPGGTLNTQIGTGGVGRSSTGQAGASGTDTWVNKSAASAPAATSDGALATAGLLGNLSTFGATDLGGLGGPTATGVGVSKNAGGRGGNINPFFFSATGGGGAAGPNGAGGNGVDITAASAATAGGNGDAGSGGAGSAGATPTSAAGGNGAEYDATPFGSGGGSGGAWANAATVMTSGLGGNYGAGSGGANSATGSNNNTSAGAPGLAVISYVPAGGPFGQFDQGNRPTTVGWRASKQEQFARNPDRFSRPFAQYDWSTPFRVMDWPRPRTPLPLNINLFENPVPFSVQWVPTKQVRSSPPQAAPYNINVYKNPIPFAQFDWSVPRRVSDILPPLQPQNRGVFDTIAPPFVQYDWPLARRISSLTGLSDQAIWSFIIPFAQYDWGKPFPARLSAPRVEGVNIALTAPVAAPFVAVDWSKPQRLSAVLPQTQPYNPLIFSEVPFDQTDWSKPQKPFVRPPQAQPYNPLIFSGVPFDQTDWAKPQRVPAITPQVQPYNLSLFTGTVQSPFSQMIWTPVSRVRSQAPDLLPYSLNLFKNEIPFAQFDWPTTHRIVGYPGLSDQAIWSFVIPFNQTDWGKTFVPRLSAPRVEGVNITLLTATPAAAPFYQTDWPRAIGVRYSRSPQVDGAILDITQPFAQYDWSKPRLASPVPVDQQHTNLSLTAVITAAPFYQTDWPLTRRVVGYPGLSDQAIWSLVTPFYPTDWSKPQRLPAVPPQAQPYNPLIFSEVPFGQTSWPRVKSISPVVPLQAYNNSIYTVVVVGTPFVPVDWSRPNKPTVSPPQAAPYNTLVYSAVPTVFSKSDWSKPQKPPVPPPQAQPYNPLIYSGVPLRPFDWSRPKKPFIPPPQAQPYSTTLYHVVVPFPFNQNYWPMTMRLRSRSPEPVLHNINTFPVLGTGRRRPLYLLGSSGYAVSYWPNSGNVSTTAATGSFLLLHDSTGYLLYRNGVDKVELEDE